MKAVLRTAWRLLRHWWLELVALLCIAALVLSVDPRRLAGVFAHLHWGDVAVMLPVVLGAYLGRALGWWVALRRIGVAISVARTVAIELAGQVLVFMPAGDLARVRLVARTGSNRRGPGALTGTIAFSELTFMSLMGLGVLPRAFTNHDVGLLVLVLVGVNALIITVLFSHRAYNGAVDIVEKVRMLRRFDQPMRRLHAAFRSLVEWRTLLGSVAGNGLAVACSFLLFFLALRAVGADQVSLVSAVFILALSHILSGLSLIPGSVGAFEGLVTVLMISEGVAPSEGAAAGLLYRGFNDLLMAAIGGLFLVGLRRSERSRERLRGRAQQGARRRNHASATRRVGSKPALRG